MNPPFAGRAAAAEPAAAKIHERNIVGFEGLIRHSGRTHEETPFIPAHTDIAGCAIGQAALHECATGGNHCFAQLFVRPRAAGTGHCSAHRLGYRPCNPARFAGQRPHSVINSVTSLAGVTSNARLSAGLPSGTTLTVSIDPEELRPVICVSSVADRSSMGISLP